METGVDTLAEVIRRQFGLEKQDIRTCSPLTLAYIGDSIYDLVIRTKVVEEGNCPPNSLHKKASMIRAPSTRRTWPRSWTARETPMS